MLTSYILRMASLGGRTAFIEQGLYRSRVYSYRQVTERARALASWLRAQGFSLQPGREPPRILLWAAPGARWAVAFYGCVLAGATVVPVDAGFSPEFLRRIAERTNASLLITDRAIPNQVGRSTSETSLPGNVMLFFLDNLEILPAAAKSERVLNVGRDALAEIVYTSGTTAEPRGVMITHGNLLANLEPVEREIRKYQALSFPFRPIRFVHLIPLSHLFGQVTALFIPQFLGGVVIFPESQASAKLAAVIRERRASVMVSVPQQLEALGAWARAQLAENGNPDAALAQAAAGHWSVPKRWWKFRRVHQRLGWKMWAFVSGGAALPAQVESLWNSLGYAVIQGYGLTETAPAITITHPFKIRRRAVGKPLPGVETRIAEDGEILVRGANVSPGYYQNRDATEENFEDGWLRTGDLGKFDEQGNLIYLGRKKEVIVTAEGLNVFPEDVENILRAHPGVSDAAVVGKNIAAEGGSSAGRTLVYAVIVPVPDAGRSELEAAVNRANNKLEPHQRIRGFSIWPEPSLPRTRSTSKLQRTRIADWLNGQAAPAAPTQSGREDDWRNFLVQLGTPAERLVPEARLAEDLGISSLDRIELLTWLETHGFEFDEQAFGQARTVQDIEKLIDASRISDQPSSGAEGQEALAGAVRGASRVQVHGQAATPPAEPRWQISRPTVLARAAVQSLVAFPLLRFYVKTEFRGLEKLRQVPRPALFVSNHQSLYDAPVIFHSFPHSLRRRLATAMGEAPFRPHSKAALFWARLVFNGYLISDDPSRAQAALRHAGWLAEKGYSTLIFPEGERTEDGQLMRFRPGVGVMAERLRLPVVPLLLEGLYELWPRRERYPLRGKARLSVGEVTTIQAGESPAEFVQRLEKYYRNWKT